MKKLFTKIFLILLLPFLSMIGYSSWIIVVDKTNNINLNSNTTAVDVYAYGILLWEMLTKQVPYSEMTLLQIAFFVNQGGRPEIPDSCPETLAKLIKKCLNQDPGRRPTMTQIRSLLESGKVTFNKANKEKFEKYIKSTRGEHKRILSSVAPSIKE